MLLQRLATGATGVKQARYRQGRHSYAHAQYIHSHCVYGRSLALAVQCETMHGVYEFRRGFCTLGNVSGYMIYYQTEGGPVISDKVSGGGRETHSLDGLHTVQHTGGTGDVFAQR